jgi:hypothetical protein
MIETLDEYSYEWVSLQNDTAGRLPMAGMSFSIFKFICLLRVLEAAVPYLELRPH